MSKPPPLLHISTEHTEKSHSIPESQYVGTPRGHGISVTPTEELNLKLILKYENNVIKVLPDYTPLGAESHSARMRAHVHSWQTREWSVRVVRGELIAHNEMEGCRGTHS